MKAGGTKRRLFHWGRRQEKRFRKAGNTKIQPKPYLSLLFIIIGITFLWPCLTVPCELNEIFEEKGIAGFVSYAGAKITGHATEEVDVILPKHIEKAVCIYTNVGVLFMFLAGVTLTTSGLSFLAKRALIEASE